MAIIENFATVSYTSGGVQETRVSNVAEIGLNSPITFTKTTVGDSYATDGTVTYIISALNTSSTTVTDLSVTDDLGRYLYSGTTELTPLTFIEPAELLINGQDNTAGLTVTASPDGEILFSFGSIAPGATANIIYRAGINEFAPLDEGSQIINTATLTSSSECADGSASATITVESGADVAVIKQMCPNPAVCGDTITYTIRVYNYGNTAAEELVLTDSFTPAPENVTVSLGGTLLPATDYTYENGVLTVPGNGGTALTVPAATYTRDENGAVITTPGVLEFVVRGTL